MLTGMNALGLIGYPTAGTSTNTSLHASSTRKRNLFGRSKPVENSITQPHHDSSYSHEPDSCRPYDQTLTSRHRLLTPTPSIRTVSRLRPKHVEIIIPTFVLAPENQICATDSAPRTPSSFGTSDYSPSLASSPNSARKPSIASSSSDSSGSKARHVEIKIPVWAQPVSTLPDSPIRILSHHSSLRFSPSTAQQPSISTSNMARATPGESRTSTMDSAISVPSSHHSISDPHGAQSNPQLPGVHGAQPTVYRNHNHDLTNQDAQSRTPAFSTQYPGPSAAPQQTAGLGTTSSNNGLSGLVCNVHRTTGREPRPLVGATTTIVGDKLFVFGGRKLSRTRPQLTADLYELDLVRRHWTKVDARGDVPPPRYFHSVCPLGDTKLVCYGGMSPAVLPNGQPTIPNQPSNPQDPQPEVVVMSDIHIFDVPTRTWQKVPSADSPQGRYAHCAAILPSSSVFSSAVAPLSAIHHNPSSTQSPNQGQLGVQLDGSGGAEMVVVGGQDSANHYIEQISVFNLRSLKWTATSVLGRSCGAYRSVTAPLSASIASKIGISPKDSEPKADERSDASPDGGSAMLIYSNYNFLDVKLELQVRLPDGTLIEKPMHGSFSPPGLRFPNGGIIENHFVVSGTFLTSSKQEYALWALDLKRLTWSRIDAGASTFSQGSWNRGILWSRRNTFVILGNRRRSLVEDYNHRRINFANVCMVELEAFGLYDNPRKRSPTSAFSSTSSPSEPTLPDPHAGGRALSKAAVELGQMTLSTMEFGDMDFIAMNGERTPASSHIVSRRWGPYFRKLLLEGMSTTDGNDTATLRPRTSLTSRHSNITITSSLNSGFSNTTTLLSSRGKSEASSTMVDSRSVNPALRPRSLYLPHTTLTIQALLHFLYTSSVPPSSSSLCTPQILCSLLQLARPYRVDGLLEAVIERLHAVLDNRNTAAIFNAAAMAAGSGTGVAFFNQGLPDGGINDFIEGNPAMQESQLSADRPGDSGTALTAQGLRDLRIDTQVIHRRPGTATSGTSEEEVNSAGTGTGSDFTGSASGKDGRSNSLPIGEVEVWSGKLSSVVGLQKRGLRGLMEGRRIRELAREGSGSGEKVGLGIA